MADIIANLAATRRVAAYLGTACRNAVSTLPVPEFEHELYDEVSHRTSYREGTRLSAETFWDFPRQRSLQNV